MRARGRLAALAGLALVVLLGRERGGRRLVTGSERELSCTADRYVSFVVDVAATGS